MRKTAEFYRPDEKLQAYQPQGTEQPGAGQWWFHDAVFSNGYSAQIMYHLAAERAGVWLDLCDPDGNVINEAPMVPRSAAQASTETLDVKIGDNWMRGSYPRYQLHYCNGDMGADLVYECLTQAVYEPPDGVYLGRQQRPATPLYFAYVFRPRCRISGTLTVRGKAIPVEGEGYADHQWKNAPKGAFQNHYWYWGKVYLPEHTLVWWDAQLNQNFGLQRQKWFWGLSGDKLIEYTPHADMFVKLADMQTDPKTGVSYPTKMVFMVDQPDIKGTATYTVRHIVKNVPLSHFGAAIDSPDWVGQTHYMRFISDVHADFEIEGRRVTSDYIDAHEIGI